MKEKRKSPRYECAFEVRYSTQGTSEIQGYTVSRNISRGGILMPVSKFIRRGDTVNLDIDADKDRRVSAVGKVRWVREIARLAPLQLDAGMEFTDIDPRDADRLVGAVIE